MPRMAALAETRNPALRIVPVQKLSYIDGVQVWLKKPWSRRELAWLARRCGSLDVRQQAKRWDRAYRVRLQLRQPGHEALQWLAKLNGVLMNYVEVALDWIFNSEEERDAAHEFIRRHHVKRWHGKQEVFSYQGARYTAKRRAANKLVNYAEQGSRISGELFCEHVEWRLSGTRALRRAGISSLNDLLELDHRQFWAERLPMRTVNLDTLGRLYCNHVLGKGPRRGPWIEFFGPKKSIRFDYHGRTGYVVSQTCGSRQAGTSATTQALIDEWRSKFEVGRCLEALDVEHLLPAEQVWPSW
jgi:hypothetical protein